MSVPIYSYLFQEEEKVTAAYFTTKTGTEYRVYFYPASEYFTDLSDSVLLTKYGFFFGFTKLEPNENKAEAMDLSVRATIIHVIDSFFENNGRENVLIFYCDDNDGKNAKRAKSFQLWFEGANSQTCFKKHDEEIIVLSEEGNIAENEYLSLIIECDNKFQPELLSEFQLLKERFISNK